MNRGRSDMPPHHGHARALCLLLAAALVYVTLLPFGIRVPESASAVWRQLLTFDRATAAHVLPACALAVLVRVGWGISAGRAALVAGAGLMVLEASQVFVDDRHARLGDVLAQCVGLLLAGRVRPRTLGERSWRVIWAAVLTVWIAWGVSAGVRGQFGHTLGPMDPTFRLVVGDEHGGGRRWAGQVHGFVISAGDRPWQDVELAAFGDPGEAGIWRSRGLMEIELSRLGGAWSSVEPVPELIEAIDRARGVGVFIAATPATIDQTGPARIVTISKGLSLRNLTIGQEGDALVCRIRTPRSGKNAASPQFTFPGVFEAGKKAKLMVWTDGGSAELYADGLLVRRLESYVSPRDWLGLTGRLGESAGVLALFVPIGLAAGMLLPAGRVGWIAGVGVPIVELTVIWGAALVLDRPMAFWLLPACVAASVGGVAAAAVLGRSAR